MKPQRTILEKITGESSSFALDWGCVYVAIFTLTIESFLSRWPQWLGWIAGGGVGVFVLLTIVLTARWRKPPAIEKPLAIKQWKMRELFLICSVLGTIGNVLLLLLALGLLHPG